MDEYLNTTSPPSDEDIDNLQKEVASALAALHLASEKVDDGSEEFAKFNNPDNTALLVFDEICVFDSESEYDRLIIQDMVNAKWQVGKAIEALEFALEERRVDEVVKSRKEEISFGDNLEECPICLEPMIIGLHYSRQCVPLRCCGKRICYWCSEKCYDNSVILCMMCREPFPDFSAQSKRKSRKLVDKHAKTNLYFKHVLAMEYFGDKTHGGLRPGGICAANDRIALKHMKEAAEGGVPDSQYFLGTWYADPPAHRNIVGRQKSMTDALYWWGLAATNGHVGVHGDLAMAHFFGDGCERNIDTYYRFMTFVAHHKLIHHQLQLGGMYWGRGTRYLVGDGTYIDRDDIDIPKSLERAKYWIGMAAHSPESEILDQQEGYVPFVYSMYGELLLELSKTRTNGIVDIPGRSCVPEVLYWFRKAARHVELPSVHAELMKIGSERCQCCKMDHKEFKAKWKKEMQQCKRCHWARYCSRECQLRHWSMGHKDDCKTRY